MSLSKIILRPSLWGIKGRLAHTATREATLRNTLAQESISLRAAIAILAGNLPEISKDAVVRNILKTHNLSSEAYESNLLLYPISRFAGKLPDFFRLLALQPETVVSEVQHLWGMYKTESQPVQFFKRDGVTYENERNWEYDLGDGKWLLISTYHSPERGALSAPHFEHNTEPFQHIFKITGCRVYGRAFYF